MKRLSLLSAVALAAVLAPSCVPYVEEPPVPPQDVGRNVPPAGGVQKTEAERQRELQAERERDLREANGGGSQATEPDREVIPDRTPDPEPATPEPRNRARVARAVPGKPGFVFSPYNNKIIDVKGIPSGTLVQDPTYPASDKKYFRVP
ncbi:hypothetical protein HNR46_002685 [Haloferula luteola]|uniref:Uncharacterized protein n=1 Tax=Haloferula luteola TaxID=595692 RepID=A0A840VF34_9BACT|nr:hypothetical protein [Haloferula luteola]MBB5352440.1 hypothetical protein [Haloferula luteola]